MTDKDILIMLDELIGMGYELPRVISSYTIITLYNVLVKEAV